MSVGNGEKGCEREREAERSWEVTEGASYDRCGEGGGGIENLVKAKFLRETLLYDVRTFCICCQTFVYNFLLIRLKIHRFVNMYGTVHYHAVLLENEYGNVRHIYRTVSTVLVYYYHTSNTYSTCTVFLKRLRFLFLFVFLARITK